MFTEGSERRRCVFCACGKRQTSRAAQVAEQLAARGWLPDLILCSDSTRTKQTLQSMRVRYPSQLAGLHKPKSWAGHFAVHPTCCWRRPMLLGGSCSQLAAMSPRSYLCRLPLPFAGRRQRPDERAHAVPRRPVHHCSAGWTHTGSPGGEPWVVGTVHPQRQHGLVLCACCQRLRIQ